MLGKRVEGGFYTLEVRRARELDGAEVDDDGGKLGRWRVFGGGTRRSWRGTLASSGTTPVAMTAVDGVGEAASGGVDARGRRRQPELGEDGSGGGGLGRRRKWSAAVTANTTAATAMLGSG